MKIIKQTSVSIERAQSEKCSDQVDLYLLKNSDLKVAQSVSKDEASDGDVKRVKFDITVSIKQ